MTTALSCVSPAVAAAWPCLACAAVAWCCWMSTWHLRIGRVVCGACTSPPPHPVPHTLACSNTTVCALPMPPVRVCVRCRALVLVWWVSRVVRTGTAAHTATRPATPQQHQAPCSPPPPCSHVAVLPLLQLLCAPRPWLAVLPRVAHRDRSVWWHGARHWHLAALLRCARVGCPPRTCPTVTRWSTTL